MKYSKEFKLDCIRKFKLGEDIKDPPGTMHDSFRDLVGRWSRIYDSLGEAGFEYKKPTLDITQRLELIKRVEEGESYSSVALRAGIQADSLIKWHRVYQEKGIDGLKYLKRGKKSSMTSTKPKVDKSKSELQRLKEENEYLKAENDYLKKLSALVQKRKAQEQKKK